MLNKVQCKCNNIEGGDILLHHVDGQHYPITSLRYHSVNDRNTFDFQIPSDASSAFQKGNRSDIQQLLLHQGLH